MEKVNKILTSAGLSSDSIVGQTLQTQRMERIEHLMALAEARRNASLREIDRHRQTLGQKLRLAGQQLEDGQLQLIESTPTSIDGPNLK